MSTGEGVNVYETTAMRQATGDAIRPGGLTLTRRAVSLAQLQPGSRVLDVGCGVGTTVEYLVREHHLEAVGVDISTRLLEEARTRHPQLEFYEGRGEALPFETNTMAGVLAECTLSLMDIQLALGEFWRVLKPGGVLLIADLYARNPAGIQELRQLPFSSCLKGAVAVEELKDTVTRQGFQWLLWEDHSRMLAELTARLIFANGSLGEFWGVSCGDGGCVTQTAIDQTRPGYFLLIARKPETVYG